MGGPRTVGIGMLGYAFIGKAHSNAYRKIAYTTWPPPLMPRLVSISGRSSAAVAEAAARYGFERHATDWRETVADPEVSCSTTAARTRFTPSRRLRPRRQASTWCARSRSVGTPPRASRCGGGWRPRASSTCAGSTTASCPRCASPGR